MFENLNQAYPFHNNFKHNLRTISVVSMSFMLIVLYFQPFGINFLESATNGYFVLVMGLVCAGTFFLNTLILPGMFPKLFNTSRWTIRKELIWNTGMFLLLAAGFALSSSIFRISSFASLTLIRSGALALLPIVLFNLMNYNNTLKTKMVQVIESGRHWLQEEKKEMVTEDENLVLLSENGKERYEGGLNNIVIIQSASNYIEIFYREGATVKKLMLRQTLTYVDSLFAGHKQFMKCHRCTLVNLNQMHTLSGASPNYTLEADGVAFRIPVSRQYIGQFRKLFAGK